jgi:hypothetical protein
VIRVGVVSQEPCKPAATYTTAVALDSREAAHLNLGLVEKQSPSKAAAAMPRSSSQAPFLARQLAALSIQASEAAPTVRAVARLLPQLLACCAACRELGAADLIRIEAAYHLCQTALLPLRVYSQLRAVELPAEDVDNALRHIATRPSGPS